MIVRLILIGVLAGGGVARAYAVDESYFNASDLPRMQPYCKAKFSPQTTQDEWNYWVARIGKNFIDLHHYCAALNYMNRYWTADTAKDRGYYLALAMNNFNYMVKAEKPDFALRGDLYSNRGEVFRLQGKLGDAVRDFRHAIELDPKLTRPYFQLIDFYEGTKRRAEALEVATLGLRHNPDSKAMQRRYLEVGGRKPFPEPIAAKAAEPVSSQPAGASPVAETEVEPSPASANPPESGPAAATEPPPPVGIPSNPYCRFCP